MSRKTRKLIWSAPLLAALAVVGALAMFVALDPGSASADGLPDRVMNLMVEPADDDAGRTTLVLNWDAVANASGYRIDKSDDGGHVWHSLVTAGDGHAATTYMDDSLYASTVRWYRVFALNSHGEEGLVSVPQTGETKVKGKPGKVRNLTATPVGRHQINLSWDPPADTGGTEITSYDIQYHDGQGDWSVLDISKETSYQDKGGELKLDPGDTRHYRVRAVNADVSDDPEGSADATAADQGPWETVLNTMTQEATAPAAPTGLTAVNTADGKLALYWFAPTNNGGWDISHYLIQARKRGEDWPDLPDLDLKDATELTKLAVAKDGGTLDAEAEEDGYNFRIMKDDAVGPKQKVFTGVAKTYDHDGNTATNDIELRWEFRVFAETTDDGVDNMVGTVKDVIRRSAPSTPVLAPVAADNELAVPTLTATGWTADGMFNPDTAKEGQINLSITATMQAHYRIDVSDDAGKTWKSLRRNTIFTGFGTADRVYEDDGLNDDTSRHYRVFSHGTHWIRNVGPESAMVKGRTASSEKPGKVTGVTASADGLTKIQASWNAPADNGGQPIVRYIIQYAADDGDGILDEGDLLPSNPNGPPIDVTTNDADLMETFTATLAEETTYRIRVAAVNTEFVPNLDPDPDLDPDEDPAKSYRPADKDVEDIAWSDVASFTTGEATPPGMVKGLTAEISTDANDNVRGVNLLWNAPSGDIDPTKTKYLISRKIGDGDWEHPTVSSDEYEERPGTRTSYTDPRHYMSGEMLTYRVAAVNSVNEDDPSNWVMVHYPRDSSGDHSHSMALTAPTDVMATDTTTDPNVHEITVTWTPGENAVAHMVLVFTSDFSAVPYLDVAPGEGSSTIEDVAAGSYEVVVVSYSDTEFLFDHDTVSVGQ